MGKRVPARVQRELYQTLGLFVIRYGYIDAAIASLAGIIVEDFGGKVGRKGLPRDMKRRLSYVAKNIRANARLRSMADAMSAYKAYITLLGNYRQYFIHGYLEDYFPATKAFRFIKIDARRDNIAYDLKSRVITQDELLHLLEHSRKVILGLRWIGRKLQKLSGSKKRTK